MPASDSGQGQPPCRHLKTPSRDDGVVLLLRPAQAIPLPIEALGAEADPPLQVVEVRLGETEPTLSRPQTQRCVVALVDRRLLGADGFAWLDRWRCAQPRLRVLLLWTPGEAVTGALAVTLLRTGFRGVLPADAPLALYREAVRAVRDGHLWLPRAAMEAALVLAVGPPLGEDADHDRALPGLVQLTPREAQIMGLLRQGLSNKDIARQLSVSPETVKKHLALLYHKTNTHSRGRLLALLRDALPQSPDTP